LGITGDEFLGLLEKEIAYHGLPESVVGKTVKGLGFCGLLLPFTGNSRVDGPDFEEIPGLSTGQAFRCAQDD